MTEPRAAAGALGTRLSAHDAALLDLESAEVPMHAGALFILEAPDAAHRARGYARFVAHVRSRLHRVPRYRQRLVTPPFGLGTPVWADDVDFDLSYHVRHAALPRPGSTQQLTEYAARILSRPLDRDRPLWELYVIEGLEDDRWAILTKSHVALIDGLDGMDLVSVLFDTSPESRRDDPPPAWTPTRTPTDLELAREAVQHLATSPTAVWHTGRRLVGAPRKTVARAAAVSRGVVDLARANVVRRAPRSLLNTRPGRSRRLGIQQLPLEDVKQVKNTFATTVTDVVLAVVADATGRYLRSRDVRTDGQRLRVLVPVATRDQGDDHALGNRVVSVLVDLPMGEMDPVERLRVCQAEMAEVKVSHRAVGAGFLTELGGFAPATFHAMASRVATRGRLYNFLVTNVPGPQQPVYCLGAELLGAHPFPPLTDAHAYAVGVISTAGSLHVGLVGDYDVVPDIDRIGGYLASSLRELATCAGAAGTRAELTRPTHAGIDGDATDVDATDEATPATTTAERGDDGGR